MQKITKYAYRSLTKFGFVDKIISTIKRIENSMQKLFKNHKIILRKTLALLLLVSIFALIFTACGENNNETIQNSSKSSNTVITRPSKTETVNSSKKSTTPTTKKSSSIQNSKPVIPNTTEYSDLLFHILINDEVNALIEGALENPEKFTGAEFDSHPYSLLARLGHDVEGIKSGKLKCRTNTIIEDDDTNSLYMALLVENSAEVPYYTEYMLKIPLNYNEFVDYKMVHEENYYQQFFINDQICKEKTVEIISKINVTVESHHMFEASLNKQRFSNGDSIGTDLKIGKNINIIFDYIGDECAIHIFNNTSTSSANVLNFQNKSYFKFKPKYTFTNNIYDINESYRTTGGNEEDCRDGIKKCTVFDNNNFEIVANADLNLKNKINLENN